MPRLGFEPFEVMVMVPEAAPLAVGANFAVNVVLCPALSVRGRFNPLILNPEPVTEAAEMVRLVPPLFVKVSDCVLLLPT